MACPIEQELASRDMNVHCTVLTSAPSWEPPLSPAFSHSRVLDCGLQDWDWAVDDVDEADIFDF